MPPQFAIVLVLLLLFIASAVRVLREYERGVVFRLGRLIPTKGPGLFLLIPLIDRMVKVDLRVITMDIPPQDIITRDNVSIKVNAVLYFRVIEPSNAIVKVEDFFKATSQLAQTTLRSVLGQAELDELLAARDKINQDLQKIIDLHTDSWGIKVVLVEVKHIDLPVEMQRSMARQAEAERERRAKIIHAEGEYQASEQLSAAAKRLESSPMAMQLRFLQTLTEVASENSSTIIFPVPIDLIKMFMDKMPDK